VLEHQVLERMIVERAELQEAKEVGIKIDDYQLDRAISRIADQNHLTVGQFRDRVEQDGTPFPKFREEVRGEIMMSRLRERDVDSTIQVSEGEIDNFLAEQTGANLNGPELDIAQILVRVPEQANSDQIEAARKKSDELYAQLQGGADFAKLAVSFSDAQEALTGGDMGWRTQDRYPQLFLDTVASLSPGQVAAPVKSANGYHILKFVGRRNANANTKAFGAPVAQTHVRHILIRVNESMPAQQARQRLSDIKQRIDAGVATFEDMARSYSNDGSSANGGDIGWVYSGDTVPEFERAMNALKPGEVSEPVESPFGVHLIQVLERKTQEIPQERLRLLARQAIHERKVDEAFQDWLRSLRARAYVEVRLDEQR